MTQKILVVGADATIGGVSTYVDLLVSYSDRTTNEWHMTVSKRLAQRRNPVAIEASNCHVLPIQYSLSSLPPRAMQLRSLLRRHRFDVMCLHTARAGLLGCLAAYGLPTWLIYTGHGWRHEQLHSTLGAWLMYGYERLICHFADSVTFISESEKRRGLEKGLATEDKSFFIQTRISADCFMDLNPDQIAQRKNQMGIPEGSMVIGNVAHLDGRKDPETFILTAARLIAEMPEAYFLWVGDGELKHHMIDLVRQKGITDRMLFPGTVPRGEIPTLISIMDVFLFTSRIEGIPFSVLEAQAAQRPIVSSAYHGVEELIEHGKTGFTFPIGDSKEAARYVLAMVNDPENTRSMVNRAHRRFLRDHADPRKMARDYQEVYEHARSQDR